MGRPKNEEGTKVISFRVATSLYAELEKYAKTQTGDTGLRLNTSSAARKLMLEGLNNFVRKKS